MKSSILAKHHELRPIVQIIDDWVTHRKLGYVFEAKVGQGRLIACSFDIETNLENRMVARQMRTSLLEYISSDKFAPKLTMEKSDLEALVKTAPLLRRLGAKLSASSEEPELTVSHLIDGNPHTIWHTEYTARQPGFPHDLTVELPAETAIRALILSQRADKTLNGQVADIEILDGSGKSVICTRVPENVRDHQIELPDGTHMKSFTLRVHTSHHRNFASLAELDILGE